MKNKNKRSSATGSLGPGSAPLTVVQLLLWVNMIMGRLGALALATEPPTSELLLPVN